MKPKAKKETAKKPWYKTWYQPGWWRLSDKADKTIPPIIPPPSGGAR